MEHFYQDIEGWFDFEDLYREAVRRMPATAEMVEVGVYKGRSCFFLAVEALNSENNINVFAVDRFDHPANAASEFVRIRREHPPLAKMLHMVEASSVQAARQFDDASLDFVFIDADHEYESVKADLAAWWPKVKPGGILAGHDFAPEFPGVERAVRERFSEEDIDSGSGNAFRIYGPRSWWVDK